MPGCGGAFGAAEGGVPCWRGWVGAIEGGTAGPPRGTADGGTPVPDWGGALGAAEGGAPGGRGWIGAAEGGAAGPPRGAVEGGVPAPG